LSQDTHHKAHLATRVIHAGQSPDPSTGAIMPPIYATSTFVQESPGVHKGLDYGRSHNPTRWALERCVADLESGAQAFAFASGLAAISTVLEIADAGSHIIAGDDMYGGTYRLFERVRRRSAGHDFTYVDLTNPENLLAAIRPETRMVWVETPTNPMLKLADLQAIAQICRERGIIAVADNTFASPLVQRPLEHGFDIVVHSATKYLNGHSDIIGGIAVVAGEERQAAWREQLAFLQNSVGAIAGPFDAFLTLRGVKTLAIRMERHCASALQLAEWLEQQPKVKKVLYPGQAPDGRLRGHHLHRPGHRPGRCAPLPGALRSVRASRKPGRRREPDRASGADDARQHSGTAARRAGHRRWADPPVGGHRGAGRSAPGSAKRIGRHLNGRCSSFGGAANLLT
jgi:cystathionine gamma-lyase